MKNSLMTLVSKIAICAAVGTALVFPVIADSQSSPMAQKFAAIKSAAAENKQALARYTWQEQQVISLKGDVKKTVSYQVSLGPDGQQQKIELGSTSAPAPTGGRLKQRIIARKTNEFQDYGQSVAALAKQYAQPDPQLLQQAYQQGNVSLQLGGVLGTATVVIKNYLKPGDSMTLVFGEGQKTIQRVDVTTYLSGPSDVVTIGVSFGRLPAGLNHVETAQVNGVSKQMTVSIRTFNYQFSQM
jgi:hypothetical protein